MKSKFLLCLALVVIGNCFAAIVYPKAPDGGQQMVMQFASDFIGKNLPPFKEISTTNGLTFAPPLQEYGSGDLPKGQLLPGATSVRDGWQTWEYIFMYEGNAVAEAYLQADENTGKPLKCTSLGSSVFCEKIGIALQKAEQLPQIQKQDYEPRLLNNPLVSFVAVWLHGQSNDFIIPLPPTYNRMNAYQLYSESHIVEILKPEAKRDIEMWKKLDDQKQKDEDAYKQAMMDYEKAHGGKCGSISFYGKSGPFEVLKPRVEIIQLLGMSSECGKLAYKVKITYEDDTRFNVKQVEVLEKVTPPSIP